VFRLSEILAQHERHIEMEKEGQTSQVVLGERAQQKADISTCPAPEGSLLGPGPWQGLLGVPRARLAPEAQAGRVKRQGGTELQAPCCEAG
jgi:hypothetical protein